MSRGFVVWFTGLSGSGKSTLTAMLAAELRARGIHVETLDGDAVRRHLSRGLGFSREDRDANIRRIGFVTRLVARSGGCAIAAAISPYAEIRNEIRRSMERFCEVYTECPLPVLAERDPKGLYKKALAGEIKNFTGVDDPYQAPEAPEVHLRTDRESPAESVAKIIARLEELGFIAARSHANDGQDVWQGLSRPHGDDLVDRLLRGDLASEVRSRASTAPTIVLAAEDLANVGAIATGLFSPLKGFTTSKDQLRILDAMRLETGVPWALPVTLRTAADRAEELRSAAVVALRDGQGTLIATLTVSDVWRPDVEKEQATFGGSRPNSAAQGEQVCVGGELECLVTPAVDHLGAPTSPRDVRLMLQRLGAQQVVALPSVDVPDLGAEHVLRCALELGAVAVVLVGGSPTDPVSASTRAACWWAVLSKYFPPNRAAVATYPRPLGLAAERAALHDALVAQNLGATHLLLPPEPGSPSPHAAELAVTQIPMARMGFSSLLGHPASHRTAPDVSPKADRDRAAARRPEVDAILSGRSAQG